LTIDLDATLIIAHSDDKDGAGKTYKRTWGHHPLNAYLDRGDGHGESLAGKLRPGNAGANNAKDHISGVRHWPAPSCPNYPGVCHGWCGPTPPERPTTSSTMSSPWRRRRGKVAVLRRIRGHRVGPCGDPRP
jgi:hypothetical protein